MTIEEAIEHCREVATENRRCALEFARVNVYDTARNCQECAAEHEQLADWLAELKQRREDANKQPEVRHGHWENIPGMNNTVFCSECLAAANKELAMKYKGCPFCLARMDGGAKQ